MWLGRRSMRLAVSTKMALLMHNMEAHFQVCDHAPNDAEFSVCSLYFSAAAVADVIESVPSCQH